MDKLAVARRIRPSADLTLQLKEHVAGKIQVQVEVKV
jgi:hypothetical protein